MISGAPDGRTIECKLILFGLLAGLAVALLGFSVPAAAEETPTLRASQLLGVGRLTGPNYAIMEEVHNDGFLNHYTVIVNGRSYDVAGNALMRERLHELSALQTMNLIEGSSTYTKAVSGAAKGVVTGAKNLVTSPVDTVTGTVKGVGSFFSSIGHSMFGGRSDQEEGVFKTAVGFDAAKRQFAYRLGIDPYTSFPPVKDRLEELSWASTAGNLTVGGAFQALPSPAKGAVSGSKLTTGMNKLLADTTPADLKKRNRERLAKMNVHNSLTDAFLEHPKYSPSVKTLLIDALSRVGIYNRDIFIQRAVLVQSEDMAFHMMRWARMIDAYNTKIQKAQRFVRLGQAPMLQRADGVIVGLFPFDYLAWTDQIANRHATNMKDIPNIQGITGGEIWFEGGVSPQARKALEAQNWVVKENVGVSLGLN